MNDFVRELVQRIDNRYSVDSSDMSLGDWICANTHLRARPFTFNRYPFQKAIADDMHPNMDVSKPSQVGLTEVQIRKSLAFITRNRGVSLVFTLPTDPMYERMSTTRVLPLVKDEKVFNLDNVDKPARRMGLIQIGTSFMYMTGAKEGDATSIPADVVMNDEVDLTDQTMLALFSSRLQNSDWKINQRFSTPTFVNFGIDAGFNGSDQHHYMLKCDACNHWQAPTFDEQFINFPGLPPSTRLDEITQEMLDSTGLDPARAYTCCEKCRAPLDLGRTENRAWVAKFASRTNHRGYQVTPFSTDRLPPEYIINQLLHYKRLGFLKGWHNTVLGRAFNDNNARLSDADINLCFTSQMSIPEPDRRKPTWIGIDMGLTCHIVVGQGDSVENAHVIIFKAISVDNILEEVETLLATYNVIGGAVDRHPYTPTANAIRDLSGGRILPVEYRGEKELNFIKDLVDSEKVMYGQANRTILLDLVARVVRAHRISFSGYGIQKLTITEQLKDMVRDESPEKPATWVKITGNDHYFHGLAFMLTAIKIRETLFGLNADHRTTVAIAVVSMADQETTMNRFARAK